MTRTKLSDPDGTILPMTGANGSRADRELVAGWIRRARRRADFSQRDLAERLGCSQSRVAAAEAGRADVPTSWLLQILATAGLRLAVVDAEGAEIGAMDSDAARDQGGRRFPAHLDPLRLDDLFGFRGVESRYRRPFAPVGYDRRDRRDLRRRHCGVPGDHPRPQQLRKPPPPPPPRPVNLGVEPCVCGLECERECVPECECQCEPIGCTQDGFVYDSGR